MKGTITIKSEITEQELIEYCLNVHHSGYDYMFLIVFHSIANKWKLDKFTYYIRLIEGVR